MWLTIKLECSNPAFCDTPEVEVSRILQEFIENHLDERSPLQAALQQGTLHRQRLYDADCHEVGVVRVTKE